MAYHKPQQGIAALELALTLPVCVSIVALMLFLGKVMYCYEVAAKAAHDGSRYLSSISKVDMKNPAQIANHLAITRQMVEMELGELQLSPYPPQVTISCNGLSCVGYTLPQTISVGIELLLIDNMYPDLSGWNANNGIGMNVAAQRPYLPER